ncbi:hypothetical protein Desti_2637 [Desulfomonile tiedjei DSM 6799]|uniref:Uncharacterized protein n=1 Tax=Desulfomonile tiedjei (strain ATCC 49306 / DSM 6799 / DCB-1) TaxID=706587 RepID=I4C6X5_DESTA|nr:hypothetical protein Desti_2637 [Desulfomonile tiedjei DSM 6799]
MRLERLPGPYPALEYKILVGTAVPVGPSYGYHSLILEMCRHGGTAPTKIPNLQSDTDFIGIAVHRTI